jgi:hypothetical protein
MRIVLLALLTACGPKTPPVTGASQASEPAQAAPSVDPAYGMAPTPFTTEQIRDSMPPGTHVRLRTEVEGMPTTIADWTVTVTDEATVTIEYVIEDEAGTVLSGPESQTSDWVELRDHAAFPAAQTTVTQATVTVPSGTFDTQLYTVQATDDDGNPVTRRFHFSPELPGPPVQFEEEQEGRTIVRMQLLERQ